MAAVNARSTAVGLALAIQRLRARIRSEAGLDISPWSRSQLQALDRVVQGPPMTTTDLASAEYVRPQSMAQTLEVLEKGGLVARRRDPDDGRRVLILATDSGREVVQSVPAAAHPSASTGGSLGALAIAGQVTATIGLPLGGVLVALGGWQITFLVNIPLALAGLVLTLLWVPRDEGREVASGPRESVVDALDPGGLVLFAGLMACLLFFLGDLQHPRWVLVGAVCVLLAALVLWELRARHPFVDVRLLVRNRALTMTYVRVAVTFLITYCVFYGLTQWLEEQRGLTASGAGLVMLPMSVLAVLISVPFSRRNMVRSAVGATAVAAVVGSVGLLAFTSSTPLWVLTLVITVFGVCSSLGMIGNQAALYQQAPAEHVGVAAGLMRTFMYTGAILSSSLISASFGEHATDDGLRVVTLVLLGLGVLLVLLTLLGARGLRGSSAGKVLRG